jgi:hypothetical protein
MIGQGENNDIIYSFPSVTEIKRGQRVTVNQSFCTTWGFFEFLPIILSTG